MLSDDGSVVAEDILTRAVRYAVGMVLCAQPSVSNHDRREAVILVQRYANVPYSSTDLAHDLEDPTQLLTLLSELATSLNPHGRSMVLHAATALAGSPESPLDSQTSALEKVAQAMSIRAGTVDAGGNTALLAS